MRSASWAGELGDVEVETAVDSPDDWVVFFSLGIASLNDVRFAWMPQQSSKICNKAQKIQVRELLDTAANNIF